MIADIDRYFPAKAATIANRELPMAETVRRLLDAPDGAVDDFALEGAGDLLT